MSSSSLFQRDEAKVGDIFKPNTLPGSKTVSRAWHFRPTMIDSDDQPTYGAGHKILLRHCSASGKWVLIIDGLPYMKGCEALMKRKFDIHFSVDSCHGAVIAVSSKAGIGMGYVHTLTVQDTVIEEIKRIVISLSVGDSPPEHVSIPDSRIYNDGFKDVTLYQIFIRPSQGGQIIAERRFSEFLSLNELIKGLKDKHVGLLPTLPRRVFTPWTDQNCHDFIEERRIALQIYLQNLLANPRVCAYTEFLCFLGLDPITGDPLQEPLSASLMGSDDDEEGFPI